MSAINREDALEAILSRLAKRKEPCPPWIYATIRECLDDLPSLPTTEPLVHDGYYLCDKKPGACPSWERKGWTKCESKYCNRTSRVDHALKLPDANDGWIPCSERLPEEDGTLRGYLASIGDWVGILCFVEGKFVEWTSSYELKEPEFPVKAWMPLPEPYQPKEDK